MASNEPFPIDWNEWIRDYNRWISRYSNGRKMARTRKVLPGRNMLSDEIIGTYRVHGQTVELSEVTMPNLSERDPQTGRLLDTRHRYVGVTWLGSEGECVNGGLVESFTELEQVLEAGRPERTV